MSETTTNKNVMTANNDKEESFEFSVECSVLMGRQ